jgi:hypothetical protein
MFAASNTLTSITTFLGILFGAGGVGTFLKYRSDRAIRKQHAPIDAATAQLREAEVERTEAESFRTASQGFSGAVESVLKFAAELQSRLDVQIKISSDLQEKIAEMQVQVAEIPVLRAQVAKQTEQIEKQSAMIEKQSSVIELLVAQMKELNIEPRIDPFDHLQEK